MKRFLSILLVILFMLPTVGVHINFTCCGDLQGLEFTQEANLNVASCCDMDQQNACQEKSELAQPPIYQTLTIAESFQTPPIFTAYFQTFIVDRLKESITRRKLHFKHESSQKKQDLSLLQVFLC